MTRRTLPQRREAETFNLRHGNHHYAVSIGHFPDGPGPAEIFIHGAKIGSDIESLARDAAVIISIALQYGVPLEVLAGAITRNPNGSPMTVVGAVLDQLNREKSNGRSAETEGQQNLQTGGDDAPINVRIPSADAGST
jgi:hypothetical protein